ncbi:MAG: hypothetical protein Fur0046_32910 [Cyanobacteria bacterium J069]|nr:MAG: XRE family transcriptional regulator [Cyanobacteria bacterium J069]
MDTPAPRPRIAELRKAAGLTQLQLSQRVGVTETTIANWERGRGGMDWIVKLIRLCDALNCNLPDLVEDLALAPAAPLSLREAQQLMKPPAPASPDVALEETTVKAAAEAIAPPRPTPPGDPQLSLSEAQQLMNNPQAALSAMPVSPSSQSSS